jgi:hypothetical protein
MSRAAARRQQRGVAALIVTMVLLFIVTLVAAYTNRNLIFEQRTSANQYRSTQAFEAAQAGIEWATAMLNGGRITAACNPSTSVGDDSFRERYLSIDVNGAVTTRNLASACVFNGGGWTCSCPKAGDPVLTAPTTPGVFPAFQVTFAAANTGASPQRAGVIRINVVACPKWEAPPATCLNYTSNAGEEGRATLSALMALHGGVRTPPASALTVRENITIAAGTVVTAVNQNLPSGGLAVVAGGNIVSDAPTELVVSGPPGTPRANAFQANDDSLVLADVTHSGGGPAWNANDRTFVSVFGVRPETYRDQPATVRMVCNPCSSEGTDGLRDVIANNPGRPIWVSGTLDIGGAGPIGSAAQPAVIVVEGDVNFTAAVVLHGAVYGRTDNWAISGNGTVEGAVVAQRGFTAGGSMTYVYAPDTLTALRLQTGSFVMVPGSWRDILE